MYTAANEDIVLRGSVFDDHEPHLTSLVCGLTPRGVKFGLRRRKQVGVP